MSNHKNPMNWDLKFKNIEMEVAYRSSRLDFQKSAFPMIISCLLLIGFLVWFGNPTEIFPFDFVNFLIIISFVMLAITAIFIVRKRGTTAENLLIFLVIFFSVCLLESARRRNLADTRFFILGGILELLMLTPVLSRVSWKKSLFVVIAINNLSFFRYANSLDNPISQHHLLVLFLAKNYCFSFLDIFQRNMTEGAFKQGNYMRIPS